MCQKKTAKTDLIPVICQSHLGKKKEEGRDARNSGGDGWEETGKEGDTAGRADIDMARGGAGRGGGAW